MLLLVDKPTGFTSFDVIRKIKRLYKGEKVGHSGTLDPMATGLLVVGIGKDTKKLGKILEMEKQYLAQIDFSKISDTWDLDYWEEFQELIIEDGQLLIEGKSIEAPSLKDIKEKLNTLIPECDLPLPAFSAKKVKGKKLYDLAREGKKLEMNKTMNVYEYEIIKYDFPVLELSVSVGSGTYIRSIAYWLGQQFGLGGILIALRRTSIGDYKL